MNRSMWSVDARNAKLNGVRADFDAGYLRYYDGEQPASCDVAVTTQRLLAELRFAAVAFPPANDGMLVAHGLTPDPDARSTGTPTWYRCFKADRITAIHDGSLGDDGDGRFTPTLILQHAVVECTEFVIVDSSPAEQN